MCIQVKGMLSCRKLLKCAWMRLVGYTGAAVSALSWTTRAKSRYYHVILPIDNYINRQFDSQWIHCPMAPLGCWNQLETALVSHVASSVHNTSLEFRQMLLSFHYFLSPNLSPYDSESHHVTQHLAMYLSHRSIIIRADLKVPLWLDCFHFICLMIFTLIYRTMRSRLG